MIKKLVEFNKKDEEGTIHEENQYLNLVRDIIKENNIVCGRNGNALTTIGSVMHFDLTNMSIPIFTTKKVAWKTCAKELFWFISGSTSNTILNKQNVNIWNDNASRDFLDSRGLFNLNENDLGPVYGHQWRHFNANYTDCNTNYFGKGKDQLQYLINCLNDPKERYSRRLIMSAWNPCQIDEMALPPCHVLLHLNVVDEKLSGILYQRSGDLGLGVPFNIMSYSLLIHLLGYHCGLEVKEFIYYLGNTHIYDDHVESLKKQLENKPYKFPTLKILNKHNNINDYGLNDIEIIDYKSHDSIKIKMRK